jgi:hypothetical protein
MYVITNPYIKLKKFINTGDHTSMLNILHILYVCTVCGENDELTVAG